MKKIFLYALMLFSGFSCISCSDDEKGMANIDREWMTMFICDNNRGKGDDYAYIIRKTKCFDFWERNVLFPKTKRSFFRTPTPLPCPFPLNFSLLIITKKFGNLAKNRYICIV